MKIYRTESGALVERDNQLYRLGDCPWDSILGREHPLHFISEALRGQVGVEAISSLDMASVRAPIGSQEVWAAGVTYFRSRDARMEESKAAGGGDFYDRVYDAERPELFFKATASRVSGPSDAVAIRDDAKWSVPEPELTLVVSPGGRITGYTIGNDMSSRDIEGENPLYLPQAKVYHRSCALGPCILLQDEPLDQKTEIKLEIFRGNTLAFSGVTSVAGLKRKPDSLVDYLYRNNYFPSGCFLLTGTGIIPPDSFTLQKEDRIEITIAPIGTLVNTVG